jgi:hypothetical protein
VLFSIAPPPRRLPLAVSYLPMPRTAEQQDVLAQEALKTYGHLSVTDVIPPFPSGATVLVKSEALALLAMGDTVAQTIKRLQGVTDGVKETFGEVLSWNEASRGRIVSRTDGNAYKPSGSSTFLNRFIENPHRQPLVEVSHSQPPQARNARRRIRPSSPASYAADRYDSISATPTVARRAEIFSLNGADRYAHAFVERTCRDMLASATEVRQVNTMIFVGYRHWSNITPYDKMRIVEATYTYVEERKAEYRRRVALGLVRHLGDGCVFDAEAGHLH